MAFSVGEHPQLAERSLGAAANLTEDQIEIAVASDPRQLPLPPAWKRTSAHRLPFLGAETLIEAGERAAGHILRRTAEATPRTVVVFVGHGGAFRHAAVALGLLDLERAAELTMNHAEPVLLVRRGDAWAHFAGAWRVRERATVPDVVAS
jgi:2,3-bisphosphoglycerate-dependent phosphoglycerate mutase